MSKEKEKTLLICDHHNDPDCPYFDCEHKYPHKRNIECNNPAGCFSMKSNYVIISKCIDVTETKEK